MVKFRFRRAGLQVKIWYQGPVKDLLSSVMFHGSPGVLLAISALTFAIGEAAAGQDAATVACPSGRIRRVTVETADVFASAADDPGLVRWAAGLANLAHVRTKRSFVRSELLFREGDCLDSLRVSESQRLLAAYPFLREANISVARDERGDALVRVATRDEWSTQVDMGWAYDGGLRLEQISATEINLLGWGVQADFRRVERRERRDEFYALSSPRLFGRADGQAFYGRSRAGTFFGQRIGHPFLGETSRISFDESFIRAADFVTYAAGASQPYSHLQIPTRRDFGEIAAAMRFGRAGHATILGVGLSHERWQVTGSQLLITNSDFDGGTTSTAPLPAPVAGQMEEGALTLASAYVGTRRFRYEQMQGLDAVSDIQTVDLGFLAGLTLAKGLAAGSSANLPAITDTYGRVHSSFGRRLGDSFAHGSINAQARRSTDGWRDVLAGTELVGYGRADWLPLQTLFLRISTGGGWNMRTPHQLTLGGRDGVRSLSDDEIPGGRRVVVFLEDRVRLHWLDWSTLDLGMTLFADAGRVWAGDAPFGQNSPWFGSAGVGLRLGVPRGTRSAVRPDLVFPLGRGGKPVFRVTYEVNRYGYRFGTPKLGRSQPRLRGPESF
jgi:hypothetical protein